MTSQFRFHPSIIFAGKVDAIPSKVVSVISKRSGAQYLKVELTIPGVVSSVGVLANDYLQVNGYHYFKLTNNKWNEMLIQQLIALSKQPNPIIQVLTPDAESFLSPVVNPQTQEPQVKSYQPQQINPANFYHAPTTNPQALNNQIPAPQPSDASDEEIDELFSNV